MKKEINYLIIDDDPVDTLIVKWEFIEHGYDVEYKHVQNEQEMRDALSKADFDVIISDHHMPTFSSLEALNIRNEVSPSIPFIIISIDIPEIVSRKAKGYGCHAVVNKADINILPEIVNDLLV